MSARAAAGRVDLETEIIRDWEDFARLAPEWNALLSQSRANAIFQRWEWIEAWAAAGGRQSELLVAVARDGSGALAGAAPFYHAAHRLLGVVPYRTLRVVADRLTGAEYPDWIARVDREDDVIEALARALGAARGWDCIWMPNVAGWTGAPERLRIASRAGGFHWQVRPREFSLVALPATGEDYLRSLSQNKRQQLRQETRRIMGRDSVAIVRCTSQEQLPRFLDALFALHAERRGRLGDAGAFHRKPREALFYRNFAPVALARGWLWLFGLEDAGELKAVQIGYVYEGVYHQLQEGFDPDYLKGAGNVLRARVIEQCIADGVTTLDFLGGLTEHKRRWQARSRLGSDVLLGRRGLRARLLFQANVWPTGRYLRPAAGAGA